MNENLIPRARLYAVGHQLEIAETLGSGKDGIILVAKNKDQPGESAIKVLKENDEWRWPAVEKILAAFEARGIYLLDVSPGNVAFLD